MANYSCKSFLLQPNT